MGDTPGFSSEKEKGRRETEDRGKERGMLHHGCRGGEVDAPATGVKKCINFNLPPAGKMWCFLDLGSERYGGRPPAPDEFLVSSLCVVSRWALSAKRNNSRRALWLGRLAGSQQPGEVSDHTLTRISLPRKPRPRTRVSPISLIRYTLRPGR